MSRLLRHIAVSPPTPHATNVAPAWIDCRSPPDQMPPRTREIRLRNGIEISTPLLIPSLSSRAGGRIPFPQSPDSELVPTPCSIVHSDSLIYGFQEPLLISAYDIHYGFLQDSNAFRRHFRNSRYAQIPLLSIDSGWYEKGSDPIDKQFGENQHESLRWEKADYQSTIDTLDDDVRPMVVSWDHFGSYPEQIAAGQDFFGGRTSLASTMLLKPPDNSGLHDFDKLSREDFSNLRAFDVVGVTEREVGGTVLDRLVNTARLRQVLDDVGVEAPIHVLGGLDPLYTPLYFAAGAELFDGLGWLRYAYREGVAMHRDTAAILDRQVTTNRTPTLLSLCLGNLQELRRLSQDLRLFAHNNRNWMYLDRGDTLKLILILS